MSSVEGYQINFAAAGDSMITRRISVFDEDRFLYLIRQIREADLAFTNMEMLLHSYEDYPGGKDWIGTYMAAEPYIADELKWAGFDIVSCATNHGGDYSYGGLLSTVRILKAVGIPNSGAGHNLAEARAPAYLETKKGRVALISVTSTFQPWEKAGEARPDSQGRPGVNGLRYQTTHLVDRDSAETLKRISSKIGLRMRETKDGFVLLGKTFAISETPRVQMVANEYDFQANLRSIRDAKRQSDWVFVSFHTHEAEGLEDGTGEQKPAEFNVEFARASIDAGADAVIGHGPHVLRGVEIYHGKPIFYSLGNFISQNDTVQRLPSDLYEKFGLGWDATPADLFDARWGKIPPEDPAHWESAVAVGTLTEHKLTDLKLLPVTLRRDLPRSQHGRPFLAVGKEADSILQRLQSMSSPYGTKIEIKEGIGEVRLD